MPLAYDPEFKECLDRLLPTMAKRNPVTIDTVASSRKPREERLISLYKGVPEVQGIQQVLLHATATDGHKIPVLHFYKTSLDKSIKGPALLHLHGGGMTVGSPWLEAKATAKLADSNNVQIFSVDYRLAPEFRQNTLVGDCYDALVWLHDHAEEFGVDKTRIGVYGESAGGGLAAGLAILARDKQLVPPLAKQILVYPMIDDRNVINNTEMEPFTSWKTQDNITGWHAYTGIPFEERTDDNVSPYCSPSRLKDFRNLPSAYIDVGTLDIFCQEDIQYASSLLAANVPTELHVFPGLPHGFEVLSPNIRLTKLAIECRNAAIQSI